MFREEDNLESPIARSALRGYYADLAAGRAEAMSYETLRISCSSAWAGLVRPANAMAAAPKLRNRMREERRNAVEVKDI